MTAGSLHDMARRGDAAGIRQWLAQQKTRPVDMDPVDDAGRTPLMHAVSSPSSNEATVRLLLENGASAAREVMRPHGFPGQDVLQLALHAGYLARIKVLIENGADLRNCDKHGYDALLHAVHGRDIFHDDRLLALLQFLIDHDCSLDSISSYSESALRTLSRIGRFDAVRLLLDAGADAAPLQWTPLMRAVALGTQADVEKQIAAGENLEDRDWWERTPWLIAIMTGDFTKARYLQEHGADMNARGRCGATALFHAIRTHNTGMLHWLLSLGASPSEVDEFGSTPLMEAAEADNLEAAAALLATGIDVNATQRENTITAMYNVRSAAMARLLLSAGADPGTLPFEARRQLLGMPGDPDPAALDITHDEYLAGHQRRFGNANPEEQDVRFWQAMIRSGVNAYQASEKFGGRSHFYDPPVWCAERFGQSITCLPDGRIVQIAGEHEDGYDPDFCIYNDVFVHYPDGQVRIFGYPETVFPPTDFHTATLIGGYIYIIGSLGYPDTRRAGETPVYRLDTTSFRIEPLETSGDAPGWIFRHRSELFDDYRICVSGGERFHGPNATDTFSANTGSFILDTRSLRWART